MSLDSRKKTIIISIAVVVMLAFVGVASLIGSNNGTSPTDTETEYQNLHYTHNVTVNANAGETFICDTNCGYEPDGASWDYRYVKFTQSLDNVSIESEYTSGTTNFTAYYIKGTMVEIGTYTCIVENCADFDNYSIYNIFNYTIIVS